MENDTHNLLIVDTSYYNFYRYFALITWYKNAHPDEIIESDYNWIDNSIFMEKFKKIFIDNIKKYQKKFKITKTIFARDTSRNKIWRNNVYDKYKKNRDELYDGKQSFKGGPVFKYSYDNILPLLTKEENISQIKIDGLEADDIIYLCCQRFKNTYNVHIISSDHDLLQLIDSSSNIKLYSANLKCYNDKSRGSADLDNFSKAILGDPSDNIEKVFPKVGPKSVLKLYNNHEQLLQKFNQYPESFNKYCINRLLVDFQYIPNVYIKKFNLMTI